LFEVDDVTLHDLEGETPIVRFRHEGSEHELRCAVVAGCDGFHGVCREAIPAGTLSVFEREYPFAWLGILAEVAPSSEELIYCYHERGFALHSMRSPLLTRLYLQCAPDDDVAEWPDERVWEELRTRLATDVPWTLGEGPIVEKGITPMRSFVVEPLRYGRLFLAGDAAHIVPPTGAKGLNLAVADVRVLSESLGSWFADGDSAGLEAYSDTCLRRVWRVQHFSWWMTSMLHRFPGDDPFDERLQRSQLRYVCSSRAAATTLAENYVGLEVV
jgi:p-hydroxybenzoate 3-monooxygenase